MTELIACLSTGKGTWGHVARLMEDYEWENIFLIGPKFSFEAFTHKKSFSKILFDPETAIETMAKDIEGQLRGRIKNFQVALNLVSGSGKEHMAILSTVLKLGCGIRMIALTKDGIKEI